MSSDDAAGPFRFPGGYPDVDTIRRARRAGRSARAVELYRFFFPSVSGLAIWRGTTAVGVVPNERFGVLDTTPAQAGLTLNSDTPYAPVLLDLSGGPVVVGLPAGPFMGAALDLHQGWLADMGIPGADRGDGGRYVFVPPRWDGALPDGDHVVRSTTVRTVVGMRVVPIGGDLERAHGLLRQITVQTPADAAPRAPEWLDLTADPQDTTPNAVQGGIAFWEALHEVLQTEPPAPGWDVQYGGLASLGLTAGAAFAPDPELRDVLEHAAVEADAIMRVGSLADDRDDRVVWRGTQWEWPGLRPENGRFEDGGRIDLHAREKWFYQAIVASPAMFRRSVDAGLFYWLGSRDADGVFLDGGRRYTLRVPTPVPARLFWSITVYDAETRSQIVTPSGTAALRSLFDKAAAAADGGHLEISFGPETPVDGAASVQTIAGRGWFVYLRIYGPEAPAFDGTWRLPDFRPAA